jgi:hypothetical protein
MESAPVVVQPVGRDRTHLDRGMPLTRQARTVVDPMTAAASRMHLTVSPEFVALLKKAKAGQSHVQPGATDEQVLTAALELFIEKQEKRKASVPAKVKREVRKRGQGKCQWPLASGGVCGSTVKGASPTATTTWAYSPRVYRWRGKRQRNGTLASYRHC